MRVLILNASHNDERLILALKKLGCYVISSGNRPDLPGHRLADEYRYGDYTDLEAMLALAKELKVDAVCPCCNDFGVLTAAYVSEKLGFKGQDSFETALVMHNKDHFKEFTKSLGGISTPYATAFSSEQEALDWADSTQVIYPVIVKAVDLSAGNGIRRADSRDELVKNLHESFERSRVKRVLVEPFIEGTQHGFCTFLINQKVVAVCSNNENSFLNPYRVEVDSFPADDVAVVRDELIAQIERMAEALHLTDGIFHLQYILKDGKAYILECMRRVLGNLYSVPAEGYGDGFDWDYWEVKAKCGFGVSDFPKVVPEQGFWAYRALISGRNGIYTGYSVPEDIRQHMYKIWPVHEPGYTISNCLSDPMGMLFFRFESAEQMRTIMIDRYSDIRVLTK